MNTLPSPMATAGAPRLVFDQLPALYSSQFRVSAADDLVMVDCSPGVLPDRQSGESVMPVHTRLAMTWTAVERLATVLNQALGQRDDRACDPTPPTPLATVPSGADGESQTARLPRLDA
jgi:hypothetical protein